MNVRKFKEIVSDGDSCKENFRMFRIWENNVYDSYCKEKSCASAELERVNELLGIEEGEDEEFYYKWIYIGYDVLNDLSCQMGWELEKDIKNRRMAYDNESDFFYYPVTFGDVYYRIEKIEDDIEYAYAIMFLVKNMNYMTELYKKYARKIFKGIVECNLQDALNLLDDKDDKVFVAMWFGDEMKQARRKIINAIKSCGYRAMLIDIKEHNNQIVPEIFKEIEESKFVIADLTGHRGGVYYEAGYAVAKEKEVILCCRSDEKTHFDVAQVNTIYWNDEDDLYDRLVKRISATIGEN